jgi:hypothetical protein
MTAPSETPWPARGCELYGHKYNGKGPCGCCGAEHVELTEVERRIANAVKYDLHDEAGRDNHAEEVGRKIAKALGLTRHGEGFAAPTPTEFWHCWATPWVRTCTCSAPDYQDENCPIHGARSGYRQ